MILKNYFLLVLSGLAWEASGASLSNVFVQTGPSAAPLVQYGAQPYPLEYPSSQIAQLNAAPFGFEYSFAPTYGYRDAAAPSANLAYSSSGYNGLYPGHEYSYVVVNQNAGDQKLLSELSNVGVFGGQYSFLPPGGFVRELQYVPDDTQGVAIVKNFLPVEEVKYTEIVHHAPPCPEVKSEALTEHIHHETHPGHVEPHEGHEHHESHGEPHETHHEPHHEDHEARHGGHEDPNAHEHPAHEKPESNEKTPEEKEEPDVIVIERLNIEHHAEHNPELPEHHLKSHHEGHEEEIEEQPPVHHDAHEHHTHENLIEVPQGHVPHESHQGHPATHELGAAENNVYVSYNEIIKCIQAAMAKASTQPSMPRPTSPLTYLVFNKPC